MEIIAEIGKSFVNTREEQSLSVLLANAKELIRQAKESGADTAKFQIHDYRDEIHPEANIISPHFDQDRYEWVKRNTYPEEFWFKIKEYCQEIGINFLATPMSKSAAELMNSIGVERWKIGSGDITDFMLLDYIRQYGKPVIISSGMSTLPELKEAYDYLAEKVKDITILHCVSNYPCKLNNLNLLTIPFLKKQFPNAKIGFSDHSLEISTGAMAVSLGAIVIEKHFTLNRDAFGSDHKVSLLPDEFKQMVKEIKEWDIKIPEIPTEALGVETKFVNDSEMDFRKVFRKGLFANYDISKGEMFHTDSFMALRPKGNAFPSQKYKELLGTVAQKSYKKYEAII